LVVGVPLATVPFEYVEAAECLSRPKLATPAGQHWFYVIDRNTNHRCWHLRSAQAHPSLARRARRAAIVAARRSDPGLTEKIADAYAELGLPDNGAQDASQQSQQTLVATDYPKGAGQDRPETVPADTPQSLVASRWPEPAGTHSGADDLPRASFEVASATPDAAATLPTERDQAPEAPPVAPASADTPPVAPQASLEPLLLATFAAIMLTGFAGSSVYLLVRVRRRPQVSVPRGPLLIDYSRPPAWLAPAARDASRHSVRADVVDVSESYRPTDDTDGLDDETREIQQLLGRLGKRRDV
jgi:hypothetical protein